MQTRGLWTPDYFFFFLSVSSSSFLTFFFFFIEIFCTRTLGMP